jgi:hypothetical protein
MTAQALLDTLAQRGVRLVRDGTAIVVEPASKLTDADRQAIRRHKAELVRLLAGENGTTTPVPAPTGGAARNVAPIDAGTIDAVLIKSAVLDGALLWLVADSEALAEHPDIIRAGLPVFFFEEIEGLRGKTPAELKAIAMVKAEFPTSRVLQ